MQAIEHMSCLEDWGIEQNEVLVDGQVNERIKTQHEEMDNKGNRETGVSGYHMARNSVSDQKEMVMNKEVGNKELDLYKEMEEFGLYFDKELEPNSITVDNRLQPNEMSISHEMGRQEMDLDKDLKNSDIDIYKEMEEIGAILNKEIEKTNVSMDKGMDQKDMVMYKGVNQTNLSVNKEMQEQDRGMALGSMAVHVNSELNPVPVHSMVDPVPLVLRKNICEGSGTMESEVQNLSLETGMKNYNMDQKYGGMEREMSQMMMLGLGKGIDQLSNTINKVIDPVTTATSIGTDATTSVSPMEMAVDEDSLEFVRTSTDKEAEGARVSEYERMESVVNDLNQRVDAVSTVSDETFMPVAVAEESCVKPMSTALGRDCQRITSELPENEEMSAVGQSLDALGATGGKNVLPVILDMNRDFKRTTAVLSNDMELMTDSISTDKEPKRVELQNILPGHGAIVRDGKLAAGVTSAVVENSDPMTVASGQGLSIATPIRYEHMRPVTTEIENMFEVEESGVFDDTEHLTTSAGKHMEPVKVVDSEAMKQTTPAIHRHTQLEDKKSDLIGITEQPSTAIRVKESVTSSSLSQSMEGMPSSIYGCMQQVTVGEGKGQDPVFVSSTKDTESLAHTSRCVQPAVAPLQKNVEHVEMDMGRYMEPVIIDVDRGNVQVTKAFRDACFEPANDTTHNDDQSLSDDGVEDLEPEMETCDKDMKASNDSEPGDVVVDRDMETVASLQSKGDSLTMEVDSGIKDVILTGGKDAQPVTPADTECEESSASSVDDEILNPLPLPLDKDDESVSDLVDERCKIAHSVEDDACKNMKPVNEDVACDMELVIRDSCARLDPLAMADDGSDHILVDEVDEKSESVEGSVTKDVSPVKAYDDDGDLKHVVVAEEESVSGESESESDGDVAQDNSVSLMSESEVDNNDDDNVEAAKSVKDLKEGIAVIQMEKNQMIAALDKAEEHAGGAAGESGETNAVSVNEESNYLEVDVDKVMCAENDVIVGKEVNQMAVVTDEESHLKIIAVNNDLDPATVEDEEDTVEQVDEAAEHPGLLAVDEYQSQLREDVDEAVHSTGVAEDFDQVEENIEKNIIPGKIRLIAESRLHEEPDHHEEAGVDSLLFGQDNQDPIVTSSKKYHMKLKIRRGNGYSKRKRFNCSKCRVRFKSLVQLKKHMISYHGDRPFQCSLCLKPFNTRRALNLHQRVHSNDRPYECTVCEKKFKVIGDVNRHMLIHSGVKPFECQNCGKSFGRKDHCRLHMEKCSKYGTHDDHEEGEMGLKSPKDVHEKRKSLEMLDFEEDNREGNVNIHSEIEADKKIPFNSKGSIYTDGKLYQCYICGRQYRYICNLNRHLQNHTLKSSSEDSNKQIDEDMKLRLQIQEEEIKRIMAEKAKKGKEDTPKPYSCDLCDRRFPQRCNLVRHMQSHKKDIIITQVSGNFKEEIEDDEQKFDVSPPEEILLPSGISETLELPNESSLSFKPESYPQNNRLDLKKDPIYKCEICDRKFGYRSNRNRHRRSHFRGTIPPVASNMDDINESDLPTVMKVDEGIPTSKLQALSASPGKEECTAKEVSDSSNQENLEVDFNDDNNVIMTMTEEEKTPKLIEAYHEAEEEEEGLSKRTVENAASDSEDKPYPCPKCSSKFKHPAHLRQHMFIHTGLKPFKCSKCGRGFNRKGNMRSHLIGCIKRGGKRYRLEKPDSNDERNPAKKMRKSFTCTICKKVCNNELVFKEHLISHCDREVIQNCDEELLADAFDSTTLGVKVKKEKQTFVCKECNFEFVTQSDLSLHMKKHIKKIDVNSLEASHPVKVVGVSGPKTEDEKNIPTQHYGRKRYPCTVCMRRLKNPESLRQHMFIHTGLRPYVCDECGKGFNRRYNLKVHYVRCLRRKAAKSSKQENDSKNPGDIKPVIKNVMTTTKIKLQTAHKASGIPLDGGLINPKTEPGTEFGTPTEMLPGQDNVKQIEVSNLDNPFGTLEGPPYKCIVCDRQFMYEGRLHHHMVQHPEVKDKMEASGYSTVPVRVHVPSYFAKKLSCPHCFKRFANIANLRRHVFLHTGLRPFKCVRCGKSFNRKYSQKIHMLSCLKQQAKTESSDTSKAQKVETQSSSCTICGKTFGDQVQLRKHLVSHIEQKSINELASLDVPETKVVESNVEKTAHSKGKALMKIKPMGFFRHTSKMKSQSSTGHTPQMPYKCTLCSRQFKCQGHLNMHLKRHPMTNVAKEIAKVEEGLYNTLISSNNVKESSPQTSSSQEPQSNEISESPESSLFRPYSCPQCSNRYTTGANLRQHMFIHTGLRPYKCTDCGKDFSRKYSLKIHRMSCVKVERKTNSDRVSKPKSFMCAIYDTDLVQEVEPEEGTQSVTLNEVDNGLSNDSTVEGSTEVVDSPHKSVRKEESFVVNEVIQPDLALEVDRPFKCNECGREFRCRGHLNLHRKKKHPGKNPEDENSIVYQISAQTDSETSDAPVKVETQSVRIHIPSYHIKKLSCPKCLIKFVNIGNLRRHMFTSHTGLRPFKCNQCGKDFNRKYSFKIHTMSCTSLKQRRRRSVKVKFFQEKPIKCPVCGELFKKKLLFRQHIVSHLEKKSFDSSELIDLLNSDALPDTHGISSPTLGLKSGAGHMDNDVGSEGEDYVKKMKLKVAVKRLTLPDGGHHTFSVSKCGEDCGEVCSLEKHVFLPHEREDITQGDDNDDLSSASFEAESTTETSSLPRKVNSRVKSGHGATNIDVNISREADSISEDPIYISEQNENAPSEATNDLEEVDLIPGSTEEALEESLYGECEFRARRRSSRKRKKGPHECMLCPRKFLKKSKLSQHMISHSTERRHTCSLCFKKFKFKGSLTKHTPKCIRKRNKLQLLYSGKGDRRSKKNSKYMFAYSEYMGDTESEEAFVSAKTEMVHASNVDDDLSMEVDSDGEAIPGSSKEVYVCGICQHKCYEKSEYEEHMISHSKERLHECLNCRKKFRFRGNLLRHRDKCVKPKKTLVSAKRSYDVKPGWPSVPEEEEPEVPVALYVEEKLFKCSICGQVSRTKLDLEIHVSTHSREEIEALLCLRRGENLKEKNIPISNTSHSSKGHVKSKRSYDINTIETDDGYACHECGEKYEKLCDIREHMQIHTKTRDYTCTICGKSFKYRGNMLRHMKGHESGYLPELSSSEQEVHLSANLNEQKPVIAGSSSGSRPNSGRIIAPVEEQITPAQREINQMNFIRTEDGFICHKCGKVFKRRCDVKQHMASHVLTRDFICNFCGKDFKYKGDMTRHKKVVHNVYLNNASYDNWQNSEGDPKSESNAIEIGNEEASRREEEEGSMRCPEIRNPSNTRSSDHDGIIVDNLDDDEEEEEHPIVIDSNNDEPELIISTDSRFGEVPHALKKTIKKEIVDTEVMTDIVIKEEVEWW